MDKRYKSYVIRDVHPDDKVALLQMQRLRYRVYHDEMRDRFGRPWIPSNPLKLDTDGWDEFAIQHFGAYSEDNRLVGCVRLTSGFKPYMFDVYYDDLFLGLDEVHRGADACESSRLTVVAPARGDIDQDMPTQVKNALGVKLLARACQYCIENGIDWWYGVTNLIDKIEDLKNSGVPLDIVHGGTLKNNDKVILYLLNRDSLKAVASFLSIDFPMGPADSISIDFQHA